MTIQEMHDVLWAFERGERIQYRNGHDDEAVWHDVDGGPVWNFARHDYRAKPEPLELYVNHYENGINFGYLTQTMAAQLACDSASRVAVHMREVI